jgi:hypothetical protein
VPKKSSRNDEASQQDGERLTLHRVRVDGEEMIAQQPLLSDADLVGLKHYLPALHTCHYESHSPPPTIHLGA